MSTFRITRAKARSAIVAGVVADILQLPLTLGMLSGVLSAPAESLDLVIDFVMAGLTMSLLGFHPALLPTVVLEAVPVLEAAPTWTACTAFVAWRRKREGSLEPAPEALPGGTQALVRSGSR